MPLKPTATCSCARMNLAVAFNKINLLHSNRSIARRAANRFRKIPMFSTEALLSTSNTHALLFVFVSPYVQRMGKKETLFSDKPMVLTTHWLCNVTHPYRSESTNINITWCLHVNKYIDCIFDTAYFFCFFQDKTITISNWLRPWMQNSMYYISIGCM